MTPIFTALHGMQTRSNDDEKAVCPSVRPSVCVSVKRMYCNRVGAKSPIFDLFSLVAPQP